MKIFSVRNFEDVRILILARGAQKNSERVGSVAIFMLAWQFLTDNSSPDILVDSHHCLNRKRRQKVTRHVRGRGNMLAHACEKLKYENFF